MRLKEQAAQSLTLVMQHGSSPWDPFLGRPAVNYGDDALSPNGRAAMWKPLSASTEWYTKSWQTHPIKLYFAGQTRAGRAGFQRLLLGSRVSGGGGQLVDDSLWSQLVVGDGSSCCCG